MINDDHEWACTHKRKIIMEGTYYDLVSSVYSRYDCVIRKIAACCWIYGDKYVFENMFFRVSWSLGKSDNA